jgi:hypothetical protein
VREPNRRCVFDQELGLQGVFAFPGVGGQRANDGSIRYLEIPQQQSTVEQHDGIEAPVVGLLRSEGFAIDLQPKMADWLKTHAVFITVASAAILDSDGDSEKLAADRNRVADMVAAVSESFRALSRQGITVTPRPLRIIFTLVPRFVAVMRTQRCVARRGLATYRRRVPSTPNDGPPGVRAACYRSPNRRWAGQRRSPAVRSTRDAESPLMAKTYAGLWPAAD